MIAVRIAVGLVAVATVLGVLMSVLRSVVLPRAVPTRLARITFLSVRWLLIARLRLGGHADYATRDRVLALQAPLGVFAQLLVWSLAIFLAFAALFGALSPSSAHHIVARSLELSGSAIFTLGIDTPQGLARQLVAFADAGVGLALLALVITYLPSLYNAFSRREAMVAKLTVRAGSPPSGVRLLYRSWQLGRFDQLEEVWNAWEDWFIDIGESHMTFPQLVFFRSPHGANHWVLAAESVLDGAALLIAACDVPRQSGSELCIEAGVGALEAFADYLGIPRQPQHHGEPEIALARELFDAGLQDLRELGVPPCDDPDAAWREFQRQRSRYEPMIAVLGRMTDAPRSDWSSWSDDMPRHSPPLLRLNS